MTGECVSATYYVEVGESSATESGQAGDKTDYVGKVPGSYT